MNKSPQFKKSSNPAVFTTVKLMARTAMKQRRLLPAFKSETDSRGRVISTRRRCKHWGSNCHNLWSGERTILRQGSKPGEPYASKIESSYGKQLLPNQPSRDQMRSPM